MKDQETNLFKHIYVNKGGSNCAICGHPYKEHNINNQNQIIEEEISLNIDGYGRNVLKKSDNDADFRYNIKKDSISINNKAILNIAQSIKDDFDDPNICRICFDTKLNNQTSASFSCNHEFCKKCVINYLNTNISNGNVSYL
jgi:superfamily II helicase